MELSVSRSWCDGRDVLYVNEALTGREVGSYDRRSGEFAVLDPIRVHAVARALWDFLDYGSVVAVQAPPEPEAPAPEAFQATGPSQAPEAAESAGAPESPEGSEAPEPETPEPSAAPGSAHRAGRVLDRALARLRRDGWVVLSPGGKRVGVDFDRLIIGPAGVFALTVKQTATPAAGPHERGHDAGSATQLPSAATGLAVKVRPVIVFVGAGIGRIDECAFTSQDGVPCEVLSARGESVVDMLWSLPAVYSAQERHRFRDVARHADFWRAA